MGIRLTDAFIKKLALPSNLPVKGNRIAYDTEVPGFGVRNTAAAAQSFILNYRTRAGRERRYTIGAFPDWTAKAAREEARRLRALIDLGGDPLADIQAGRDAPTVADLCRRYEDEHLPRKQPRSAEEDRILIRTRILPALGSIKVADVTYDHIDGLHRKITKQGKPYRANRTVALLSKMFSLASTKWRLRSDNPCRGIERNPEPPRERYLSGQELARLTEALAAHPDHEVVAAIRLLLLTGARKSEVLSLRWADLDLDAGTWTKLATNTKQNKIHHIPLSPPALELLVKLRELSNGEFLFPGRRDGHRADLREPWAQICKAARLDGVRLHDLRHTYASILASGGASLPMIGKLLGHSNVTTTQRYAHLAVDPLRELTTRVGAIVSGEPEAELIQFKYR